MRFMHLGDIHFGANWRGISKAQALVRDQELLATFDRALDLGLRERVEVILIAGDLFDSPLPPYGLVQEVKYRLAQFDSDMGPRILITPGNHDPWVDGSPYSEPWPASVFTFSENWECLEVAGRKIRGFGFQRHGLRTCPLPKLEGQTDILVLHADWQAGSGSNYCPIGPEHLAAIGARYTALGHIHKAGVVWTQAGQLAAYSGSLEPLGFDEPGQHGVWLGTLGDELKLDFVPMATREVRGFSLVIDQCQAREQFVNLVLTSIPVAERQNYCLIRWVGDIDPRMPVPTELKELEKEFFALRLENNARPAYDLDGFSEYTLRSEFVKEMQLLLKETEDAEQRAELELAIWYGLDALTWGRVMSR